jgi:heptosyltransferase I
VVRTLQRAWPAAKFTWIIGRVEAKLLGHIPDIEFIVVDKKSLTGSYRVVRQAMRGRYFDILMHMQVALRASLLSTLVPARIKLGFDRKRARELQWLFTTNRVRPAERQHVLDSLFGFAEKFHVYEKLLRWDIPLPQSARAYAQRVIPDEKKTLIISPCSSHPLRNWRAEYYAQIADYAVSALGMRVLLCGGRSELEQRMGDAIMRNMTQPCENTIGQDTLLEFLATLERSIAIITPDSGPAHMATAVGTPVIGLYATSNRWRTGPYLSQHLVVDKYPEAVRNELGASVDEIRFGRRVRDPNAMDLIRVGDVIEKLDLAFAERGVGPVA